MFLVMNIGCIECGVSSNVVGVFTDKDTAQAVADTCQDKYYFREGGQNSFEVFELPDNFNTVNEEYDIDGND